MEDININKTLVSKKEPYSKESLKYYIGYNDDFIRLLCIKLPQMIGYIKPFKNNNNRDTISVFSNATNNRLLKKYNKE